MRMDPKTYTEEDVQRLVNQQRTVTTWENMMDRLGGSMSQQEYNLCETFRRMLLTPAVPAPAQTEEAKDKEGGDKYPE